MRSPIAWLNAVTRTTFREIKCLVKNPGEVLVTFVFPLVWMLVVWGLLGKGVIEQVPVAMVDNDNTSVSCQVALELSSIRAIKPVVINTQAEALEELKKGTVYGIISIPFGYMKDTLSGRGSSISVYLDENRYAVAGGIQGDISGLMSALKLQQTAKSSLATGIGPAGARRLVEVVHSDFYALGNMGMNFNAFLGSNLIPGVLFLGSMFCFVTAIIREDYRNSIKDWLDNADNSMTAALVGKLAPHYFIYSLIILWYLALFAGQGGWAPSGSLFVWFASALMCLAAFLGAAILICAIAPTWRFALVVASGYAAPALPFTGFSIPTDSMSPVVQFFAELLPLTWFIRGQSQQWVMGANVLDMGEIFSSLGLLIIIPLIFGIPLLKRKYFRKEKNLKADPVSLLSIFNKKRSS